MKAIIHLGMHKTGTSSIQKSFANQAPAGFLYPTGNGENLNVDARLLFEEDTECLSQPRLRQAGAAALPEIREATRTLLLQQIKDSPVDQVILSAERFTYMSREAVSRFKTFLDQHFSEVAFYAYIRDPLSFVKSSFQQRIKSGARDNGFRGDYPKYRDRFEKYEEVFGRTQMQYRLFRRDHLEAGNAVLDFAKWIGGTYRPEDVRTANEGISAEALALLYVYRQYGNPATTAPRPWPGPALFDALAGFGDGDWHLTEDLADRILSDIATDCAWMNDRLDQPLSNDQRITPNPIFESRDFEAIALQAFPRIQGQLGEILAGVTARRPQKLAAKIDFLREIG